MNDRTIEVYGYTILKDSIQALRLALNHPVTGVDHILEIYLSGGTVLRPRTTEDQGQKDIISIKTELDW